MSLIILNLSFIFFVNYVLFIHHAQMEALILMSAVMGVFLYYLNTFAINLVVDNLEKLNVITREELTKRLKGENDDSEV